jgi:hypothetical protein
MFVCTHTHTHARMRDGFCCYTAMHRFASASTLGPESCSVENWNACWTSTAETFTTSQFASTLPQRLHSLCRRPPNLRPRTETCSRSLPKSAKSSIRTRSRVGSTFSSFSVAVCCQWCSCLILFPVLPVHRSNCLHWCPLRSQFVYKLAYLFDRRTFPLLLEFDANGQLGPDGIEWRMITTE